jgi:hypothetical protein
MGEADLVVVIMVVVGGKGKYQRICRRRGSPQNPTNKPLPRFNYGI